MRWPISGIRDGRTENADPPAAGFAARVTGAGAALLLKSVAGGKPMADVASRFLIKAMIAKNERRLAGRLSPPPSVSLYSIYEETIRLRQILAQHEADIRRGQAETIAVPFRSRQRPQARPAQPSNSGLRFGSDLKF
jgi:hypothetical protein